MRLNQERGLNSGSFEPGTLQTVAFAQVKKHAEQRPFTPFRIVTTSDRTYDVPTGAQNGFLPLLRLIMVTDDNFGSTDIRALHVATIEPRRRMRRKRAA